MSEFRPLPSDARRRIEKWRKEHLDEIAIPDYATSVVSCCDADFNDDIFKKLQPQGRRELVGFETDETL